MSRIRLSLLKYCVRGPIFQLYTKPILEKVLTRLRVPSALIGYLLAYINYFRYYSFMS